MTLQKNALQKNKDFKWKTSDGLHLTPKEMRTSHLFYTVRMIWNHCVPTHMRVGKNIKYYTFGPEYTKYYIVKAIRELCRELDKRELPDDLQAQYDEMKSWNKSDVLRLT